MRGTAKYAETKLTLQESKIDQFAFHLAHSSLSMLKSLDWLIQPDTAPPPLSRDASKLLQAFEPFTCK